MDVRGIMTAATTTTSPQAGTWSPFRLGRYGGLPVDALPAPDLRVVTLLAAIDRSEVALDAQRDHLIELLYTAVPTVERAARRRLLAAKRAVFAGTGTRLVDVGLDAALRARCEQWDRDVERRDALVDELRSTVDEHEAVLADALRATLRVPEFSASLAVAAPEFVRGALAGLDGPMSAKMLRTLYQYVARTSRKTSPFSGLTAVAEPGRPVQGRSNVAVAHHLAAQLVHDGALSGAAHVLVTPSPVHAWTEGDGRLALIPRHSFRDGIVFREETVVHADHVVLWSARVADEDSPLDLDAASRAVGGNASAVRIRRLIDSGALRPVIPWGRGENPYDVLPALLPEGVRDVGKAELSTLKRVTDAFVGATASQRVDLLDQVRDVCTKVFPPGALGDRPGGLVYEDCESPVAEQDPLAAPAVAEDLERLAALVEPAIFRSHLYDVMVRRFVAAYGSGGTCREPLAFFMALAVDNDGDIDAARAFRQDLRATAEQRAQRRAGVGPTAVARHLGAYLQFVAPSVEDLAAGRGLTVVNMFGSGNGALQARYHRMFGADYRNRLRRHVQALWRPEVVLELEVWASCNTGQAQSAGILPELRLPSEPRGLLGVSLDGLRLIHDPAEDALILAGREPVGLAYLGLTPQHLLPSYFRWLALLADPWVRFPAHSDHSRRQLLSRRRPTGRVHAVPREQNGRLVTGRATWWVPVDRDALFDPDDVALVRAWHRLVDENGMPRELFAHQSVGLGGSTDDTRKPQYVDTTSPLSLRCLERWLAPSATELVLVEALPDRSGHISRYEGKARVSEYVANLAWTQADAP